MVVSIFPSFLCHQMLRRSSNILIIKSYMRYSSARHLCFTRHLLKGHPKSDISFKQIQSFGFLSTGLLTEHSTLLLTPKRCNQTDSGEEPPGGSSENQGDAKMIKKTIKKKQKDPDSDYYSNYTKNILLSVDDAEAEYNLKKEDIEKLTKIRTRSAYGNEKVTMMVTQTDVEKLALEIHGCIKKKGSNPRLAYHPGPMQQIEASNISLKKFLEQKAARVVVMAIIVNGVNTLVKFIAWQMTNSDSMLAESIHSFADTCNQMLLFFALYVSNRPSDSLHPYGYGNIRPIIALLTGVAFFLSGTAVCLFQSYHAFCNPELLTLVNPALYTMGFSFITESVSLIYAGIEAHKSAKQKQISFWKYIRGDGDLNVSLVFLEDVASVSGVVIATSCMYLAHFFQSSYIDAFGSVCIGLILAWISKIIVKNNMGSLIGRSIPEHQLNEIKTELLQDRLVRTVQDVKAISIAGEIRFKAEIAFDGQELARTYLKKLDSPLVMKDYQNIKTAEELEKFQILIGEGIIEQMGMEVDRLEKKLKKKEPKLRHVDLEIL